MPTRNERAEKFALFIDAALTEARKAGMTNADIEQATGISKSTFYRWRDGDNVNVPRVDQVWDFCVGLGIPPDAAGRLLGWTGEPMQEPPESRMEAPLRRIHEALSDPRIDAHRKRAIRDLLRAAANLAEINDLEIA